METINLTSFNIWGQKINEGTLFLDKENETLITRKGRKLKVITNKEFTFKIQKTQIKANNGIDGLSKFLNEINTSDSPFNPCYTDLFIEL